MISRPFGRRTPVGSSAVLPALHGRLRRRRRRRRREALLRAPPFHGRARTPIGGLVKLRRRLLPIAHVEGHAVQKRRVHLLRLVQLGHVRNFAAATRARR